MELIRDRCWVAFELAQFFADCGCSASRLTLLRREENMSLIGSESGEARNLSAHGAGLSCHWAGCCWSELTDKLARVENGLTVLLLGGCNAN